MTKFLYVLLAIVIVLGVMFTGVWGQVQPDGSVKLSWMAPTTNEDGTPLLDLVGFKIYETTIVNEVKVYTEVADFTKDVLNVKLITTEGPHCYVATAYDDATPTANESIYSNEACGVAKDVTGPATFIIEIIAQ